MRPCEQSATVGDTLEHRQFGEVKLEGVGSVAGAESQHRWDGHGFDGGAIEGLRFPWCNGDGVCPQFCISFFAGAQQF